MDDQLATVLIVAGGAVTLLWLASFAMIRLRAHRRFVGRLHAPDAVERARAAVQLVECGRWASARAVYLWVPTEPDGRTRRAVAMTVLQTRFRRRQGWAGRSLQEWAQLEANDSTASPEAAAEPVSAADTGGSDGSVPVEPVEGEAADHVETANGLEPIDDAPPPDPIRWRPD